MICPKCKSTKIKLKRDSRGIPSAYCADCDTYIKKMSTGEVIDHYEARISDLAGSVVDIDEKEAEESATDRGPCRFCTENYIMRVGRVRTEIRDIPIEPVYCPMCGRKLRPEDKAY